MGIIIFTVSFFLVVFLIGISAVSGSTKKKIFVAFFASALLFIFTMGATHDYKLSITQADYTKALQAKAFIESQDKITTGNLDVFTASFDELTRYNNKRMDIYTKSSRFWDGIYYNVESLDTYPPVFVDEDKIQKFK